MEPTSTEKLRKNKRQIAKIILDSAVGQDSDLKYHRIDRKNYSYFVFVIFQYSISTIVCKFSGRIENMKTVLRV